VLERICDSTHIFNSWSDEEWINEGAAVRVSLVCFGNGEGVTLDGNTVEAIHADLTAGNNLTQAHPLKENAGQSYFGLCLAGAFKGHCQVAGLIGEASDVCTDRTRTPHRIPRIHTHTEIAVALRTSVISDQDANRPVINIR
jgi:hypothetical protein